VAAFSLACFKTRRCYPYACLAAAYWGPAWWLETGKGLRARVVAAACAAAACACAWVLVTDPQLGLKTWVVPDAFPQALATRLKESPLKHPFANVRWHGDYLLWRLGPSQQVFVDSRLDMVYPPERALEEGLLFSGAPAWRSILAAHGIHAVIVPMKPRPSRLFWTLSASPDWLPAYFDGSCALFLDPEEAQASPAWPVLPGLDLAQARVVADSPALAEGLSRRRLAQGDDALGDYLLGQAQQGLGRIREAEGAYRAALRLDPGQAVVAERLRALEESGRPGEGKPAKKSSGG
jgi:hypothetical protein